MKFSIYIATSLDGFIARPDGDIEWLFYFTDPNDKEDYGYADFMAGIDCLVMGRNTLEKVLTFPDWPYTKPVIVISNTLKVVPENCKGKIEIFAGSIDDLVIKLKAEKRERVYIDGGKTIQSFLAGGYATDLTLTRIPILIGSGILLFGSLSKDIKLKHIDTRVFPSGFVQSKYEL
jgi:dihydrofolate reductase